MKVRISFKIKVNTASNGGFTGLSILMVVSTNTLGTVFKPSLESSVESLESPFTEPWGHEPLVALLVGPAVLCVSVFVS